MPQGDTYLQATKPQQNSSKKNHLTGSAIASFGLTYRPADIGIGAPTLPGNGSTTPCTTTIRDNSYSYRVACGAGIAAERIAESDAPVILVGRGGTSRVSTGNTDTPSTELKWAAQPTVPRQLV